METHHHRRTQELNDTHLVILASITRPVLCTTQEQKHHQRSRMLTDSHIVSPWILDIIHHELSHPIHVLMIKGKLLLKIESLEIFFSTGNLNTKFFIKNFRQALECQAIYIHCSGNTGRSSKDSKSFLGCRGDSYNSLLPADARMNISGWKII